MATLNRRIRNSLSKLDAFPKTEATYQTRTSSGGLLTVVLSGFLLVLAMSEFADYRRLEQKYEFLVDQSTGSSSAASKLQVNIDMTIAMKCECRLHQRQGSAAWLTAVVFHPVRQESQDALNVRRLIKDAQRPASKQDDGECSRFAALLRTHAEKSTFNKRPRALKTLLVAILRRSRVAASSVRSM
ncbi:MAG: endoplasmic reticulum-golgi intermediate compartment-domain-containing protein [Olpidium bornovanus]|uniref:Endoplasmic reticulum-golgi intermediate compartment-domain-containing protein n=1 Tax=Olpidium bornovanus TaxID=278681 RepID=A0A8H7ZN65_9FUNG|nr:MAG: endoplasmic reticulum-golgi intermediate compartment-domain-containing protein [Olpidium bornovanus]